MLRNKKGIAIPFFAIMIVAIIGLGALVIDISQAYSLKTRIKSAIDLSCIAGISQLVNQSNISTAKDITLQYLNDNLTMTIPSFNPLTLSSQGLSVQVGVYDISSMNFTWDEANPKVNAIMISYTYNSMNILGPVFMIDSIQVQDSATSVKQIAGHMAPGGGFPLAIQSTLLSQARANNNMVDLVQAGTANSFFTAFDSSNASTDSIKQIVNYFKDQSLGVSPPSLTVGEEFQINNGNLTSLYMTVDDPVFEGMTYVAPIVQVNQNFTNKIKVEGFIGFTINDIYKAGNNYHIAATIIPGYVDNRWSGLTIAAGPGADISPEDQALLASSYGLVQ